LPLLPIAQVPLLCQLVPRQRKALAAVELIRDTTNKLIKQCKEMVDEEEMAAASAAAEEGGWMRHTWSGGGRGPGIADRE
jgi:carotene epsilon-monooxygenase